ncbi:hypothetical protein J4437_04010 [Candidatus Woesearchaeota archaeon]|nr:hypothetical protein [uncultured archaeon]MBS3123775.1 hypothetical protein [Candidatus Woesearchaeota archaeon]
MEKRGQLGIIEFKFFIYGFIVGIIGALVLVLLGKKKIIPFQIPVVCGLFGKKGQLGMIEFQYFMVGLGVGLVAGFILVYLGTTGVIPFKIPVC